MEDNKSLLELWNKRLQIANKVYQKKFGKSMSSEEKIKLALVFEKINKFFRNKYEEVTDNDEIDELTGQKRTILNLANLMFPICGLNPTDSDLVGLIIDKEEADDVYKTILYKDIPNIISSKGSEYKEYINKIKEIVGESNE